MKQQTIKIEKDKRILVVSDIHGSLNLLKKLFAEAKLNSQDIIIILGDIIEKGHDSLGCIRYLMELQKHYQVYAVMGNCDYLCVEIKNLINTNELMSYAKSRKYSIINEMIEQLDYDKNCSINSKELFIKINEVFEKEINWICDLPDYIESEKYIFTHAGFKDIENFSLTTSAFLEKGHTLNKTMIVGHYPVCNYFSDKYMHNPIIDEKKRIISIDGANNIRTLGQLNLLCISEAGYDYIYVDSYEKATVVNKQINEQSDSFAVTFQESEIKILERFDTYCIAKQLSSGKEGICFNSYCSNGRYYGEMSDYILPVEENDCVSVFQICGEYTLAKKDGIVGWVQTKNLLFQEMWDLYDKDGNSLNRQHVRGMQIPEGCYHYVVHIYPFYKGKLLITKRADSKTYGGYWETTGGSVLKGETAFEGAKRELLEECGVTAFDESWKRIDEVAQGNWINVYYTCEITSNHVILQKEETSEYRFVDEFEFLKMKKDRVFALPVYEGFEDYAEEIHTCFK